METLHPLKYISQTFQIPLAEVATQLGVKRQTVNEWVGKRRKQIPEKHIVKLSEIFQLDEKWFRKQILSGSERLELQRIYIDRNATFIEYEDYFTDDEGNVHEITKYYSPEREESEHLFHLQQAEKITEEVKMLIDIEVDAHDDFYQKLIRDVILVTKSKEFRKIMLLQDVISFLLYHDYEFGFMDADQSKTDKLNELLSLYK